MAFWWDFGNKMTAPAFCRGRHFLLFSFKYVALGLLRDAGLVVAGETGGAVGVALVSGEIA